jgi:hypothetical protein
MWGKNGRKVRASALMCVQAVARVAPKEVHGHWASLLAYRTDGKTACSAAAAPLHARSVLTALLHDPSPKARCLS